MLFDMVGKHQRPVRVVRYGLHEYIGHRQVEMPQPPGLALCADERTDIGMVTAQRRHHGAAACAG